MTQQVREPQPNDLYRHWKGDEYRVIGVGIYPDGQRFVVYTKACLIKDAEEAWNPLPSFLVRHTETSEIVAVNRSNGEISIEKTDLPAELQKQEITLAWARPLANFLEILGNTNNPIGGTMFYRFELVASYN